LGKVRKAWRDHLGLQTDDQLIQLIGHLRIHAAAPTLDQLRADINVYLRMAGFRPLSDQQHINHYDAFIRTYSQNGVTHFDRDSLEAAAKREGYWVGQPAPNPDVVELGVRTFLQWTDYLEDRCDALCDLAPLFAERSIRSQDLWHTEVLDQVSTFLRKHIRHSKTYHLHIDAHSSIAFAIGHLLAKSPERIIPCQRTDIGREPWLAGARSPADPALPSWEYGGGRNERGTGNDVAVSIGVTHDIAEEVSDYVASHLPNVGRHIHCHLPDGPTARYIQGGTHAAQLAATLSSDLRSKRSLEERRHRLHLFIAAPNAFTYLLGRHSQGLGACMLYEYNFGGTLPSDYHPSLSFPLSR
jgi:hypothetical protein